MKKYVTENEVEGQMLVAITSGANMDFNRLRFVSERADGSEKTLIVDIPETPGSFRTLYSLIWPRNVTEFSYRFDDLGDAHILISFQPVANIEDDFEGVVDAITENGFTCTDVSNSELTKVHIRNMAGGRSNVPDERLFRFDFPESPGALQRFLLSLDIQMNVSLFHYRNHGKLCDNQILFISTIPLYPFLRSFSCKRSIGDDFGRVLVGIQVPEGDEANDKLHRFLNTLHYNYVEETDNPIYHKFLRSDH